MMNVESGGVHMEPLQLLLSSCAHPSHSFVGAGHPGYSLNQFANAWFAA